MYRSSVDHACPGAPLTSIVLVAIVGTADSYSLALLTISAVLALMISLAFQQWQEKKNQADAT
jgi:hypothetical protein